MCVGHLAIASAGRVTGVTACALCEVALLLVRGAVPLWAVVTVISLYKRLGTMYY